MQSAAASQVGLASDTADVGAQGHAAGLPVVPPGLDPCSKANAARIKACTSQVGTQLGVGAELQNIYGVSVAVSAAAYRAVDELNATTIGLGGLF
jgi:hypothetical protein